MRVAALMGRLNGRYVGAAALVVVVLGLLLCQYADPVRSSWRRQMEQWRATPTPEMAAVYLLEDFPDWTGRKPSWVQRNRFRNTAQELGKLDSDALRSAISSYLAAIPAADQFEARGKIYVLNRYLFAVPSGPHPEVRRFGGFWDARPKAYSHQYLPLWPLEVDRSGNLVVSHGMGGYMGPGYRALQEFDYFRDEFGRRSGL